MLFAYQTITRIKRRQAVEVERPVRQEKVETSMRFMIMGTTKLHCYSYIATSFIKLLQPHYHHYHSVFGFCSFSDLAQSVPGHMQFPAPELAPPFWQAVRAFRFRLW